MNCSPFDLKDYFFGELPVAERSATESHLASCPRCREELARLGDTRALLMSVPDEEPPRRIAFVSDKVFEPRWWQRVWNSGPQLGFAASAMLATAILVHGFALRPAAATVATQSPAPIVDAKIMQAEIDRRVEAKMATVLADREAQQMERVMDVVNTKARLLDSKRREDLVLVGEYLERFEKRSQQVTKLVNYANE